MNMIVCPRCSQENEDSAMNCVKCRINLEWALVNLQEGAQPTGEIARPEGAGLLIGHILISLELGVVLGCGVGILVAYLAGGETAGVVNGFAAFLGTAVLAFGLSLAAFRWRQSAGPVGAEPAQVSEPGTAPPKQDTENAEEQSDQEAA